MKYNVYYFRGGEPVGSFDTEEEATACKDGQKAPSEYFVEGDSPEFYLEKRAKIPTNIGIAAIVKKRPKVAKEPKTPKEPKRSTFKEVKEGLDVLKKERLAKKVKAPKVKSKVKTKAPKAKGIVVPKMVVPVVLKSVGRTLEDIKLELAAKKKAKK